MCSRGGGGVERIFMQISLEAEEEECLQALFRTRLGGGGGGGAINNSGLSPQSPPSPLFLLGFVQDGTPPAACFTFSRVFSPRVHAVLRGRRCTRTGYAGGGGDFSSLFFVLFFPLSFLHPADALIYLSLQGEMGARGRRKRVRPSNIQPCPEDLVVEGKKLGFFVFPFLLLSCFAATVVLLFLFSFFPFSLASSMRIRHLVAAAATLPLSLSLSLFSAVPSSSFPLIRKHPERERGEKRSLSGVDGRGKDYRGGFLLRPLFPPPPPSSRATEFPLLLLLFLSLLLLLLCCRVHTHAREKLHAQALPAICLQHTLSPRLR